MKKIITITITAFLLIGTLGGCSSQSSSANSPQTPKEGITSSTDSLQEDITAYNKLISFKTQDYTSMSIANFNDTLIENNDLSELLDAHSKVIESLTEADDHYEFFSVTLIASLDELYCEEIGDDITFFNYVRKASRPIKALNEDEEKILKKEPAYEFIFTGDYTLNYVIKNTDKLTIGERDEALCKFQSEFQSYIDYMSEEDLMDSNIKEALSYKVNELAKNLSSENLELNCNINNIIVHNNGSEVVY